jgi:predicted ATPase
MKPPPDATIDIGNEYILLRLARDLIREANVLAVDEFQLPDPYFLECLKLMIVLLQEL